MSDPAAILFTAFEPSGDALAAPLIAELKRRDPDRPIHALGGPKMAAAGAELIETTTDDAVMGVPPLRKVVEHRARLKRLRAWMRGRSIAAVIPTDSPAANWSVCQAGRALHPAAKVIHLAAPQLWAWAPWRIGKMRRLSDQVLCLLPFEPDWFEQRGVPAAFVGHPIFTRAACDTVTAGLPHTDRVKIALLPGSRDSEVAANLPTMLDAVKRLAAECDLTAVIAAVDDRRAVQIEALAPHGAGDWLTTRVGRTADVLAWADVVLVVSGTATLQVAAQGKPMVIVYNASPLMWHGLGRWIVSTRTFTLPNLIGRWLDLPGGRRVPELVPHFGAVEPVRAALAPLMVDGEARGRQCELFEAIRQAYAEVDFARSAADAVEKQLA